MQRLLKLIHKTNLILSHYMGKQSVLILKMINLKDKLTKYKYRKLYVC